MNGTGEQMEAQKPARRPFYYGWVILGVCAFAQTVSIGAGGASFSVFLRPMSESLGWSRTVFTGAVTLQSLMTLMAAPFVGMLLDRYGPRFIMACGALIAGVAAFFIGGVTEPWQFYLLYSVAAGLGLNEVGDLVTTATVSKWFVRMRGRALAINSAGINFGQILFAPFTAFLIATFGWQSAWSILGITVVVLIFPLATLLLRRVPEDMGLLPDGDPEPAVVRNADGSVAARRVEVPWTVRKAFKTRTLWMLVLTNNLSGIAYGGVLYHLNAYYTDIGLTLQLASAMIALNHAVALITKWPLGILSERIPVRYGLVLTYAGRIGGLLFLLLGTSPLRVFGFVLVSGTLSHSIGMFQAKLWADYYGRAFLGSIRGFLQPITLVSSIGGPLFAAFMFDKLGSYNAAFWVFVVTLTLAAITVYFAKPPGEAPADPSETNVVRVAA